jgi:hypothetical protein
VVVVVLGQLLLHIPGHHHSMVACTCCIGRRGTCLSHNLLGGHHTCLQAATQAHAWLSLLTAVATWQVELPGACTYVNKGQRMA